MANASLGANVARGMQSFQGPCTDFYINMEKCPIRLEGTSQLKNCLMCEKNVFAGITSCVLGALFIWSPLRVKASPFPFLENVRQQKGF